MQQFSAMFPIKLTNADIRNSDTYKEYYAVATGATPPKTKASVQKTRSSSDTTVTLLTAAAGPRLSISSKGKQPATTSKAKSLSALSKVAMTEAQPLKLATKRSLQQTHISQASVSSVDEGTGSIPGVPDVPTDEHQNTQQFCTLLPIELTNEDIRNSNAYKEYYAVATGATPPKYKASIWKTRSSSDIIFTHSTAAAGPRLSTSAKGKQLATTSKTFLSENSTDEEGEDDDDDDEGDDENEGNDEDDQEEGSDDEQAFDEEEFIHPSLSTHVEEETRDEESYDPISKTPENTDHEGNGEENLGMNVGREEEQDEEDEADELYRDVNINLGRGIQLGDVHTTQEFEDSHVTLTLVNLDGQQQSSSVSSQFVTSMLNLIRDAGIESIFETTSQTDVQTLTSRAPLPVSEPTLTTLTIATITTTQQEPTPPTIAPTLSYKIYPTLARFKIAVQLQFDRLRDEAQKENDEFLKTIDENMQKIIKEKVKEQVKVQVSKILPKIEQTVNEQLEAEVLTWSSNSSKTSYVVAADLSEMELKKIIIEKMEGNKSIHRSNEQRNLYKALVEGYESDKIILDTYEDTVTLKRRHDDDTDKDEESSAGLDRGSKRRREEFEPESASAPREKDTRSVSKSTQGSKSRQMSVSESATTDEPMQTTFEMEEPSHIKFETGADNQLIVEPSQHPEWFSQQKKPPTPDRRHVIPFDHFLNNDLEYLRGGASSRKYTTSVTKTKVANYGHIKWIEDLVPRTMWIQEPVGYDKHALWGISYWGRKRQQFFGFTVNWESASDVYSKRRIIAVTELKIVEWQNYKHLDWIMVRRDDDKLYKFKEGNFKRLHIQDIEDMLLLLVQGKLTNLTIKERFAFNKKLNLTNPDTYRSDLKHKEAYITYLNPRGSIYQNKDKQNRLMRIDELHKFSDGTLIDVRTALDDHLKGFG
nr:hypothetical protein [Tanacetum cinerariifolium]